MVAGERKMQSGQPIRGISVGRTGTDAIGVIALIVALGLGVMLPARPAVALVPVMGIGAALILVSPFFRLTFVVVGGMLALNSTVGVTDAGQILTPKFFYLAGTLLALGVSLYRVHLLSANEPYHLLRAVILVSLLFAAFIGWEMLRSSFSGVDALLVLRDAAPYLLFAAVPLLSVDAVSSKVPRRWITWLFIATASVGTFSYTLQWTSTRNVSALNADRLTLAGALPAALLSYAFAGALMSHRLRALWAACVAGVIAMLVVTGNRATILYLLAPISIAFLNRRHRVRRLVRLATVSVVALFLVVNVLVPRLAGTFGISTQRISDRFSSLIDSSTFSRDQSLRIRLTVARVAWHTLEESPLLGSGPGHVFTWKDPITGTTRADNFTLDTPLVYPAKFGYGGLALLVLLMFAYGWAFRGLHRTRSIEANALMGFGVVAMGWTLLIGPAVENMGFVLGFLMMLTMSLARLPSARTSPLQAPDSPDDARGANSTTTPGELSARFAESQRDGPSASARRQALTHGGR